MSYLKLLTVLVFENESEVIETSSNIYLSGYIFWGFLLLLLVAVVSYMLVNIIHYKKSVKKRNVMKKPKIEVYIGDENFTSSARELKT